MDINDIRKRRALINRQISKGFNDNFSQENISKAYDDEFNKAHKVGDIHPNGKWVWTEIKPGKFDWRVIKKTKGSTSGSKVSPTVAAKVKVGNTAVNGVKSQAKTNIQNQGYGFILDESGNKIPLTLEVAEAVYKRWSNSVPVNTGKGKFPWRPSAVPSPKMKNDGLDFRTADGCKADIADRAAAAKKLVDKIKADQAAKTPTQKSIDKQLVDAGYFMFCKFTNGDFMYLLSDPKKAGYKKDIAPAVTLLKKGGFRVGIYEQADGQNITNHYKKKITEFSYGPRVDCKDVPALAKSLTEVYHNFCCLQGRSWKARVENDGHFHITYNYPGSDGEQRDVGYAVVIPVDYGESKPGDIMVHIEVGPKQITHLTDNVHEAEHTINIAKDKSASYSIKKAELQKIKAQLQAAQDKLTKEEQTINAWVDKVNNM